MVQKSPFGVRQPIDYSISMSVPPLFLCPRFRDDVYDLPRLEKVRETIARRALISTDSSEACH